MCYVFKNTVYDRSNVKHRYVFRWRSAKRRVHYRKCNEMRRFLCAICMCVCDVRFSERICSVYGSIGFSVEHTLCLVFGHSLSAQPNINLFKPFMYICIHVVLIVWFLLHIFANFIIEMSVFGGEIKNTLLLFFWCCLW